MDLYLPVLIRDIQNHRRKITLTWEKTPDGYVTSLGFVGAQEPSGVRLLMKDDRSVDVQAYRAGGLLGQPSTYDDITYVLRHFGWEQA